MFFCVFNFCRMPDRKQKYKPDWLKRTDSRGCRVREYLRPTNDETKVKCLWCSSIFSIADGFNAISKHIAYEKHGLAMTSSRGSTSMFDAVNKALSVQDKANLQLKSEILWAVFISKHASFNCASETARTKALFKKMFPNDVIAQNFACGRTKATYLITKAVAPFLNEALYEQLRRIKFSLCLDESNNTANFKQLDLNCIFWNESKGCVQTEFLTSIFLTIDRKEVIAAMEQKLSSMPKLCSAEILHKEVLNFMSANDISVQQILAINRYGPNVMKSMIKLFIDKSNSEIIDFGACKLHGVNNCIQKAVTKLDYDVLELTRDLKYFFKDQALRLEELAALKDEMDLPDLCLINHSNTRFLTLLPFCQRLILLLDACKGYFLHYLPLKGSRELFQNERYKRLCNFFSSPSSHAVILFLSEILPLFQDIQLFLQRDDPIGPLYLKHISHMLSRLANRFIIPSVCEEIANGAFKKECVKPENQLKKIYLGHSTEKFCSEKLSASERKLFELAVKSFYIEAFQQLLCTLNLSDEKQMLLWRSLEVLHPNSRKFRSEDGMVQNIKKVTYLAELVPSIIPLANVQNLLDEWNSLASDNEILRSWAFSEGEDSQLRRIDDYWQQIFHLKKYPLIKSLVSVFLCLQPHNAAEERGFSINNSILTKERNRMQPELLNSIRRVHSYLNNINGLSNFEIPDQLLLLARDANKTYIQKESDEHPAKRLCRD